MKLVANFIVKTNEWYENLPKLSGEMFYLGLVFIPYLVVMLGTAILFPSPILAPSMGLCWVLLVIAWRISFKSIIEYRKLKKK